MAGKKDFVPIIVISIALAILLLGAIRVNETRIGFFNSDSFQMLSVKPDGSDLISIQNFPSGEYSWSKDGSLVACKGDGKIDYLDMNTKLIKTLSVEKEAISDMRISPDKRRIAYMSASGDVDIYVSDLSTGKTIQLTNSPEQDSGPEWSPDADKIAFQKLVNSDHFVLYIIDANGTNLKQITQVSTSLYSWSQDSSRIAVDVMKNDISELEIIELDNSNDIVSTVAIDNASSPCWAPDGKRLLYSDINGHLCIADEDGTNIRQLVVGHDAMWRRDGGKIVFVSDDSEIYVMNPDGSNIKKLLDQSYKGCCPKWSSDGNSIMFTSNWYDGQLYMAKADGTSIINLTPTSVKSICCTFWQELNSSLFDIIVNYAKTLD